MKFLTPEEYEAIKTRGDNFMDTTRYADELALRGHIEALEQKNKELREALVAAADLFLMMDEGLLVRDTTNDSDSGWAIKQLRFVARLKAAHDAISKAQPLPSKTI